MHRCYSTCGETPLQRCSVFCLDTHQPQYSNLFPKELQSQALCAPGLASIGALELCLCVIGSLGLPNPQSFFLPFWCKCLCTPKNVHWLHLWTQAVCSCLPGDWGLNFQMFKLDLEKAEEPEIKLPTSIGSLKKQESPRKTSTSALLTTPKPLTVWITTNYGKFIKRWEYQSTWPASWEICMQVKKQQLELDVEQLTDSKSGKEYFKPVYWHPAYLIYMQSTSC